MAEKRTADDLADEELDALANVSEEDVLHAMQSWEQDAPPEAKALLEAEPDEEQ